MKNNRSHRLRNTETNIERNFSVKDLCMSICNGVHKSNSLLVTAECELLKYISLEMNIPTIDLSKNNNLINSPGSIKPPFLLFLHEDKTTITNLNTYKNLFNLTNHIILTIPLAMINENENYFSDLIEYLNLNNYSILDIFGGYSSHRWQPDNMFGKIYIVFANKHCKS